jgi:hypothetical protein
MVVFLSYEMFSAQTYQKLLVIGTESQSGAA